jgi:hypothetical protein
LILDNSHYPQITFIFNYIETTSNSWKRSCNLYLFVLWNKNKTDEEKTDNLDSRAYRETWVLLRTQMGRETYRKGNQYMSTEMYCIKRPSQYIILCLNKSSLSWVINKKPSNRRFNIYSKDRKENLSVNIMNDSFCSKKSTTHCIDK